MEEVQRDILGWDFYSIVTGRCTLEELDSVSAGGIPIVFEGLGHYTRVFWALLLEELRAHIQQVLPPFSAHNFLREPSAVKGQPFTRQTALNPINPTALYCDFVVLVLSAALLALGKLEKSVLTTARCRPTRRVLRGEEPLRTASRNPPASHCRWPACSGAASCTALISR